MNFGAADETCHALGWRVLWCYRQGGPDVLDISPGSAKPLISAVASESSLRHQKVETPGHVFLDEICLYAAGYLFRAQCSYVHRFPAAKPCFHFCCPMLPFNHSIFGWSFEAFACVPSWEFLDLFNLFIFRVSSIGGIYSKTWVGVFCCFNRHWFLHVFFWQTAHLALSVVRSLTTEEVKELPTKFANAAVSRRDCRAGKNSLKDGEAEYMIQCGAPVR